MSNESLALKERLNAYQRQQALAEAAYERETGQSYPAPPDISGSELAHSGRDSAPSSTVSAEHINAARYRGYPEQAPTPLAQQNAERTPAIRFKDSSLVDEHGTPVFQSQDIYS